MFYKCSTYLLLCLIFQYHKYDIILLINCRNQTQYYTNFIETCMTELKQRNIKINVNMSIELSEYLQQHNIDYDGGNVENRIYRLLVEKDQTIATLESHITKYKAEQSKTNKIISQLQQKISQLCPSSNNTSSHFMMPSEFKDYFQEFMKNCLSSCLSPLLPHSQAYASYAKDILVSVYGGIKQHVDEKLSKICQILILQDSEENMNKVKISLLKLLQDNWQALILDQISQEMKDGKILSKFIRNLKQYENQQIVQIVQSEQYSELDKKLIKICGYMILQQKRWQFVFPSRTKIQKYTKKDYVCIDGWIKQNEDVLIILQGLVRQNDEGNLFNHPNLKNYVIPYEEDVNDQEYRLVQLTSQKQDHQNPNLVKVFPLQNVTNSNLLKVQKIDQCCQYSPKIATTVPSKKLNVSENGIQKSNSYSNVPVTSGLIKIKAESNPLNNCFIKNKHEQNQQDQKQFYSKIETAIRKLNKFQAKHTENCMQVDSVSVLLSPNIPKAMKASSHQNSNNTLKLHGLQNVSEVQSVNPSITMIKSSKQKNNCKNSHNLISDPSFEQILSLPQRKKDLLQQMPLKREPSRSKKSNSRKASAGKIVGQTIQSKQNMQHRNNREHTTKQKERDRENKENSSKQAIYKDMIKQKLGADHKTEREKAKEPKHKQKDEDRPLRIMHFKKIRQKYLNL